MQAERHSGVWASRWAAGLEPNWVSKREARWRLPPQRGRWRARAARERPQSVAGVVGVVGEATYGPREMTELGIVNSREVTGVDHTRER